MLSFQLKQQGNLSAKMVYNGREIAETRQNIGLIKDGSLTSAFAEVYNPKGENVDINILVDSSAEGVINSAAFNHNLSIGSISMPIGSVFKHINSNALNFKKTDNYINLMRFDLNINYQGKTEAYFMFIYNFAIKLSSKANYYTRFNIDGIGIKVKLKYNNYRNHHLQVDLWKSLEITLL